MNRYYLVGARVIKYYNATDDRRTNCESKRPITASAVIDIAEGLRRFPFDTERGYRVFSCGHSHGQMLALMPPPPSFRRMPNICRVYDQLRDVVDNKIRSVRRRTCRFYGPTVESLCTATRLFRYVEIPSCIPTLCIFYYSHTHV